LKPAEVEEVSLCFELGRATIIVREDQLSLAIGRRGQNVRLAARLTGWDIDILTPEEFAKGLENLEVTVRGIEGITEVMLDRMGALGMISVFDIEEVGEGVLVEELELTDELAATIVERAAARAHEISEEQAKAKVEADAKAAEEQSADAILSATDADAESSAASILGGGPVESSAPASVSDASPVETTDAAAEASADALLGAGPASEDASTTDRES
jgi:transcription termination/antitermination protein NusA